MPQPGEYAPGGPPDDGPGSGRLAGDDQAGWEETWAQSEAERVASWLRAKTRREVGTGAPDPAPVVEPQSSAPAGPDLEEYRRNLVAGVETAQLEIERFRHRAHEARALVEAEVRSLEKQRRRLAAQLETQEAEAEHVHREHLAVRDRLAVKMGDLEARRRALADDLESAQADAETARREQLEHGARLEAAIRDLGEQRQQLAAAVDTGRLMAAAAFEAHAEERARLEAEISALEEERRNIAAAADAITEHQGGETRVLHDRRERLAAALETSRSEAEAAHNAHVQERARLEAEIRDLEAEGRRGVDRAVGLAAKGPDASGADHSEPLDPSGRLAATVAELGRHLAAILDWERAEAARRADERREAQARREAELRFLEEQRRSPPPEAQARRRRRRRS